MHDTSLAGWAALFAPRFEQLLPRRVDGAWITRFVDAPRFGWDLPGLQAGFIDPLYSFVDALALAPHDAPHAAMRHLRPALACRLIAAMSGDEGWVLDFEVEMAALELHALAAMMLDHLDNGRSLAAAQGGERALALPVLITVAYSARQLAASMLWREGALAGAPRAWLAQRFSRLLLLQGIGHTLDLWGGERGLRHHDAAALADHVRWYLTPLDFALPCDLAAAALGLAPEAAQALAEAGSELGLAWHARRWLAQPPGAQPQVRGMAPPLRWNLLEHGSAREALAAIAVKAQAEALAAAGRAGPRAAEVFEEFLRHAAFSPTRQAGMEVTA